ncbi:MAG: glucosaminidase domain-containing protein [Desulfuromonadales bacterium]|jgi:Bax protein|nr:glucosaminidase domain-containing protein [Desulfuromonadales bacterium]
MRVTSKNRHRLNWLFSCAVLLITGCQDKLPNHEEATRLPESQIQVIRPATVDGMQAYFQALDYRWENLNEGVPPFILEQFPDDFDKSLQTDQRKETFFMGLLPMVLLANQSIMEARRELLAMLERFKGTHTIEAEDQEWLQELTNAYGLRGNPLTDHRTRTILLRRVDTIPPSLALAQAANESAWGMSRFAKEGNNLFGQWTFTPGTGIVPKNRPPGATYEVQRFKSLNASIRGYIKNLNTHSAYRGLRLTRGELRAAGKPVTGKALAGGLSRYSTRGAEYVQEIRAMINHNDLSVLNQTALNFSMKHATEAVGPSGSGLLASRYQVSRQ